MNMRRSVMVTDIEDFMEIMTDNSKIVHDYHLVGEHAICLEWSYHEATAPVKTKLNPYIALFTTSHARLKLYEALELTGDSTCYEDTDSIIFVSRPGVPEPKLGVFLGEFTDELPLGTHIEVFGSGGPKNYAYKLNTGETTCKVRGFTLNHRNSMVINAESVLELIKQKDFVTSIRTTDPLKIVRNKRKFELMNQSQNKDYKLCFSKRQLQKGSYVTYPFGYRK